MIICWDVLEKLHINKNGKFIKGTSTYYEKVCPNCLDVFLGISGCDCCCHICGSMYRFNNLQNLWKDDYGNIVKKRCSSCDVVKKVIDFNTRLGRCKECECNASKIYVDKNRDVVRERSRNKYVDIKDKVNKRKKIYRNSFAKYKGFYKKLYPIEECRNIDTFLEVHCTYCWKWYKPTICEVGRRLQSINNGNNRFYCSDQCKQSCSIFHRSTFPRGFDIDSSREVQAELRKMRFEFDNWTCQRCGKHQSEFNVPLHCHHLEGIRWEPIESCDVDMCITVCETCHHEIHKREGCSYSDLQCKE